LSCYWDIKCVDCDEYAGIDNANREMELMQFLVAKKSMLADLSKTELPSTPAFPDVELQVNGHHVDLRFFAEHETHLLRPVDESGRFDTPCGQTFLCPKCGICYTCQDREHPGFPHHHTTPDHKYHPSKP
jgi:hypothetical protein